MFVFPLGTYLLYACLSVGSEHKREKLRDEIIEFFTIVYIQKILTVGT